MVSFEVIQSVAAGTVNVMKSHFSRRSCSRAHLRRFVNATALVASNPVFLVVGIGISM
jgi:hypothetical protein